MLLTHEPEGLSPEAIVFLKLRFGLIDLEEADCWTRENNGASEGTRLTDLFFIGSDVDYVAKDIPYLGAVSWIANHGNVGEAAQSYGYRKFVGVPADWIAWHQAETELRLALVAGKLIADAVEAGQTERLKIAPLQWRHLRMQRSGSADVLTCGGVLKPEYADVYVPADCLKRLWPADNKAKQSSRATVAAGSACTRALVTMMREAPNDPIPKLKLREQFNAVSNRGFDRAFRDAVQESKAEAWSKSGRRRKHT